MQRERINMLQFVRDMLLNAEAQLKKGIIKNLTRDIIGIKTIIVKKKQTVVKFEQDTF